MKIAVVGATGLVGRKMTEALAVFNIYPDELILAASERSVGKTMQAFGAEHKLLSIQDALNKKPDLALFSAGGDVSKTWAKQFAEMGCTVIDNSSAWRMNQAVPLVVPEVNAHLLNKTSKLIANPNCSTIQLVHVLYPLHRLYELKRVVVSTYQSVTGSGIKGITQLKEERAGKTSNLAYPHPIDLNCLPHGGDFLDNHYTTEEMKLINESRKIMNLPELKITSTVVRVPVYGGHSESVNISFQKKPNLKEIKESLSNTPGIIIQDNPSENLYPMPIYAKDKDETFVGRIRIDESEENSINLWIVADNLRKGAATNSVQIANYLIKNQLV